MFQYFTANHCVIFTAVRYELLCADYFKSDIWILVQFLCSLDGFLADINAPNMETNSTEAAGDHAIPTSHIQHFRTFGKILSKRVNNKIQPFDVGDPNKFHLASFVLV